MVYTPTYLNGFPNESATPLEAKWHTSENGYVTPRSKRTIRPHVAVSPFPDSTNTSRIPTPFNTGRSNHTVWQGVTGSPYQPYATTPRISLYTPGNTEFGLTEVLSRNLPSSTVLCMSPRGKNGSLY